MIYSSSVVEVCGSGSVVSSLHVPFLRVPDGQDNFIGEIISKDQ